MLHTKCSIKSLLSSFEGYPLQVRHKQDWGRGFILLLLRLLQSLNQMLAVMSLSQHRVSSSKTIRPRAPCGARCIGHAVSTWSAVCTEAPHSQFGEGARLHLCMEAHPNRPGTGSGHKSTEPGSISTILRFPFVICPFRSADAKTGKVVQKIPRTWHKRASGS